MNPSLTWILPAIVAAFAQAGLPVVSERLPVPPMIMLWWMRLVAVLVLLPFALMVSPPTDPLFYGLVLIGAAIFSYSDMVRIGVAAKSGAGIVTRLDPLSVGITFVIWTGLNPDLLQSYLARPWQALGIVAALIIAIASALRLAHCTVSRAALVALMPQLLVSSFGIVIGKFAMLRAPDGGGPLYYALIQSGAVWLFYLGLQFSPLRRHPAIATGSGIFSRRILLAGLLAGIFWLLHTPIKWLAIDLVANPAYVTMVGLSAPLFVLAFDRLTGRPVKGDLIGGFGIVFGAALLIYCSL